MNRLRSKPAALAAIALSAVALAGCGESAEQKATAKVCKARSSISAEIKTLEGLTISSSFITEAKKAVESIGTSLKEIKEAQPDLAPARKEQIAKATETFQKQMSSLAAGLTSGLLSGVGAAQLKAAEPEVKAGLTQLADAYKQALEPISCPS